MQENRRKTVTLVLGGVRSGKSRYAQQLGERAGRVVFIATASRSDEEMTLKIERHIATRPKQWLTVEEPLALPAKIALHSSACDLILIDCLTLFAANLMHECGDNREELERRCDELCAAVTAAECSIALVSNEVGSGVVPAYALGRQFRDTLGELNQSIARIADNVLLMTAGLPLALKGEIELAVIA